MANRGEMLPNHLARQIGPAVRRELLIDSARVLMLWGTAVAVSTVAGGNTPANATHAIAGLLLWVLGVWLLALVPAGRRFPQAAMVAAAVVRAVLSKLFAPWN